MTMRVDPPMSKEMKDLKIDDISDEQWERMIKCSDEQDRKYEKFVKEEERKTDLYYKSDTYKRVHQNWWNSMEKLFGKDIWNKK